MATEIKNTDTTATQYRCWEHRHGAGLDPRNSEVFVAADGSIYDAIGPAPASAELRSDVLRVHRSKAESDSGRTKTRDWSVEVVGRCIVRDTPTGRAAYSVRGDREICGLL
jgi:hypothetical protein